MFMYVMQVVVNSHRVGSFFAPHFDQTLVSGVWVTGGDASDHRFIQLTEDTWVVI